MSDHDPEVTPEQEARVRRLLEQSRHGDPVPVDVAARLDRVLEQLAAEGPDPVGHGVRDLAARRRRRVTGLLVAAAAVVVVGVGIGQVRDGARSESDSATASSARDEGPESADAGGAAGSSDGGDTSAQGGADQELLNDSSPAAPDAPVAPPAGSESRYSGRLLPPVRLSEDRFAKQAVRFRYRRGVPSLARSVIPGEALSRSEDFVCDAAAWGAGTLVAALYDGVPTVLAYRPPTRETQTVDLLRCGTGEVLRSTVLPVAE
ncbi:MAG: hypothetical protein OSB43_09525 [Nocardioides sp.]|uniref:hypothetical protein n=1 Tax=Nocardioides sp. TaxID=35761 RepID=UPI0023A2C3EB|nr:hypothetical protein [Nocardioides sp.]MDE0776499.1 hypothetical protein [Nocardioides sp.]